MECCNVEACRQWWGRLRRTMGKTVWSSSSVTGLTLIPITFCCHFYAFSHILSVVAAAVAQMWSRAAAVELSSSTRHLWQREPSTHCSHRGTEEGVADVSVHPV